MDGLAHPLYSARSYGPNVYEFICKVIGTFRYEEQSYKSCNGILHMCKNNPKAFSVICTTISECERNDLFEVIQSRTDKKSTIYCSQWAPEGWLGKLGDGPLADAILDRIRNSSYTILLKGRSLREDYSKIK